MRSTATHCPTCRECPPSLTFKVVGRLPFPPPFPPTLYAPVCPLARSALALPSMGAGVQGVSCTLSPPDGPISSKKNVPPNVLFSHRLLAAVCEIAISGTLPVTIAKAIVRKSGRKDGSASVESILDYVSKVCRPPSKGRRESGRLFSAHHACQKWKNLRRKDGSQYSSASTYIRYDSSQKKKSVSRTFFMHSRAVQANLRSTANGVALFKARAPIFSK